MARLVYTKNANELVSSLQSQLDLLAQEIQKNLAGILSKNGSLKTTITAGQENVYLETMDLVSSKTSASKQIYCISGQFLSRAQGHKW